MYIDIAITPLVHEIKPPIEEIENKIYNNKYDSTKQCIIEYKDDLILAMNSLSLEYYDIYPKESS